MAKFQINILGCGSATPTARHQPSCQVVNFRDKLFMIDCGEGRAVAVPAHGAEILTPQPHLHLSHLHGDHLFGLPGLLSTMALHEVSGSVTIHIFRDGARLMKEWMDFFNRNSPFEIIYDVIEEGERRIVLRRRRTDRGDFSALPPHPCTGFIFREKLQTAPSARRYGEVHNIPIAMLQAVKEGSRFRQRRRHGDSQRASDLSGRSVGELCLLQRHDDGPAGSG